MKKIGLVGAGVMGERYILAFSTDLNASVVAVCELIEAKGFALAGRHGIENVYTEVETMIASTELDAIVVATPDFAHKDPVIIALRAGLDVLCEKPLSTSVDQAVEMVLAADNAPGQLMVNFGNRHRPAALVAQQALDSGRIGQPRYIYMCLNEKSIKTATLAWSAQTSALWFLISHLIDFVQWMLDDSVVSVYATNGSAGEKEVTTLAVLNFSRGATAMLESTWDMPMSYQRDVDLRLSIHGDSGVLDLNMGDQGLVLSDKLTTSTIQWDAVGGASPDDWWNRSCRYFSRSISEGTRVSPDARQGLATVLVLSALQNSLDTGAAVSIAERWPNAIKLLR
jgi:predicted dehydrogenase